MGEWRYDGAMHAHATLEPAQGRVGLLRAVAAACVLAVAALLPAGGWAWGVGRWCGGQRGVCVGLLMRLAMSAAAAADRCS